MAFPKGKQYIFSIAWRQITSKKGRNLSFMTMISILGVAIGVAALVVVLSVMGGFENDLKSKMFRGLPHMEILNDNIAAGFSLKEFSLEKIKALYPDAIAIEPFTQSDVVIKRGKHLASLTLFGIDPKQGGRLWGFSEGMIEGEIKHLLSGSTPFIPNEQILPGIILGESLASQLGAMVGDDVSILSPQSSASDALGGSTISARFRVVGLFVTDLPRFDTKYGVVSLSSGRQFMADYDSTLDEEEYVTGIALNLAQPEDVKLFVDRASELKGLKIHTWKNVNKSLLFALKLEKFTMGAILLLIVLVAAFSISGTMMMTVYHKRRYVSILRSLGMSRQDVARLFLTHGFSIGTIGVLLGILVGVSICGVIYLLHFIDLNIPIFYQKKLPVAFLPLEYLIISICAWILSLLAALYPAMVAAKQDPGAGLRCL